MIQSLKQYLQRRRARKIFSRIVSPSVVDDLLDGKLDFQVGQLDARTLEVVFILVGGSTPSEVAQNISKIAAVAREQNTGHDSITGPLMVFCAGRLPADKANREQISFN